MLIRTPEQLIKAEIGSEIKIEQVTAAYIKGELAFTTVEGKVTHISEDKITVVNNFGNKYELPVKS